MKTAAYWIDQLQLKSHPEGGFYKETYRAPEIIDRECLPPRFGGRRSFSTSIYFLLRSEDRSCFHRIKSDELWHYHAGSSLTIFLLTESGLSTIRLGSSPEKGESLQLIIPANTWFGAKVNAPETFVLSGCTVAPGFDFQDFDLGKRQELLQLFPLQKEIIEVLTTE